MASLFDFSDFWKILSCFESRRRAKEGVKKFFLLQSETLSGLLLGLKDGTSPSRIAHFQNSKAEWVFPFCRPLLRSYSGLRKTGNLERFYCLFFATSPEASGLCSG